LVAVVLLYRALGGGWNLDDPQWVAVAASPPSEQAPASQLEPPSAEGPRP
jgi:hypothetical protein